MTGRVFRGCCSTCHLRFPWPPGRGRALRRRRECHCTNVRSLVPSAPDTSAWEGRAQGPGSGWDFAASWETGCPAPRDASRQLQPALCRRHEGPSQCVARVSKGPRAPRGRSEVGGPHSPWELPAPCLCGRRDTRLLSCVGWEPVLTRRPVTMLPSEQAPPRTMW